MDKIGKYEVLEKIGVGGFGVVYKAYDPFIKRLVAIKTCTADDEDIRQRFFQEAEIAGNLQHRNVVTVYDFGVQGEVPYLIQEYLTGEDLDRKIKRRENMPHRERLLFLVQIARGLEYAHSKGVIHRDIKPANIRILEDGTAKIMDFGIAKLAQRQSGLTQTGMTLGTAAYLAPEQIRGEPVDQRTDIFSLGVLAYELLTFERPFSGEVISTVLYQILNSRPRSIAETWPDSPSDFVAVVERCLEKDQSRRYANCAELLRDLDQVLRRMRASASRSPAETSGFEPTTTAGIAITRSGSLPLPAQRSATTATTGLSLPVVPPPSSETEVDLAFDRYRRTPHSISTSAAYREKEVSKLSTIAATAAVVIALGAGLWYWQGRPSPTAAASSATPPAAGQVPGTSPASSAPVSQEPSLVPARIEPPAPVKAAPVVPPPVPEKATIVVAAAWDPQMTVTVDGATRALEHAQTFQVTPGRHVLSFALTGGDYSQLQEKTIEVRSGSTTSYASPIVRPGRLTVQPAPSSPLGTVMVDGDNLGPGVINNKAISPGTHRIEIRYPRQEVDGSKVITQMISVESGVRTTVTFNLLKDTPPSVFTTALSPP
ncbi:MAG: serine/threonine-protein kinase [Acidobacteriota bacterium]